MYRLVKTSKRTQIYYYLKDITQHKHKKLPDDHLLTIEEQEERTRKLLSGEYHKEKAPKRLLAKAKEPTKYNKQNPNLKFLKGNYDERSDKQANESQDSNSKNLQISESNIDETRTDSYELEAYERDLIDLNETDKLEGDYQMEVEEYWKKQSKHNLHRYSEPPPLPPTRYPDELSNMPTLMATQNADWYGAEGWDAPVWQPEDLNKRLEIFERRRRDLPDGYTIGGKELKILDNPKTGGMVATFVEPHGPVAEMAKRAAGRLGRQWSNLDRNDNIYESRMRAKFNVLASLNNANSELSYNDMEVRIMRSRDEIDGRRQWARDVAKHGVDHNIRHWVEKMHGAYRMKVVGIEESRQHKEWYLSFRSANNLLKEYLTKDEYYQEISAGNQVNILAMSDLKNNLWGQEHFFIEALDFRYSLIDADGLDRCNGLNHIAYLNLEGCRFIDDEAMTKLHYFSESLEYLDLSNTRITMKGFNFIHLLKNLKWLNLSNMIDISDEEVEDLIPLLRAVLPPHCTIVTTFQKDPEVPLLSSPEEPELVAKFKTTLDTENDKAIVIYEKEGTICEDVHKLWEISPWMEDKQMMRRKEQLMKANTKFDRMTSTGFMQYVNRANTMKPLY